MLAPIHAAVPEPASATVRPCPQLRGRAFNLSWGRLDQLVAGTPAETRNEGSADILPFNDDEFSTPKHYRGKGLHKADAQDLARVARAHERMPSIEYVRVARSERYVPPQLSEDDAFEPGSLSGWLMVFDREGELVCAVRAQVESSESVNVNAPDALQDEDRARQVSETTLLVDLTQHLAGALREAAKPAQRAVPTTPPVVDEP
ncbi:hypothetical protein G6O69_37335 [Pseudenhygromyxa sp. WMMC2535]|nr:hypothetical protein [Pseudenhygromyxa sp. WMMC2535]NVB43539.1 hypothetical protein [Pseudenhygromyxa sp. WMMC2535]